MEPNVFMDKENQPSEKMVMKELGHTAIYWQKIRNSLEETYGPLVEDWKFYSKKYGWTLKLLRKKRNLFFFTALDGGFQIVFVFGDKAVAEIQKADIPAQLIEDLLNARKYAEGRGLRLNIKNDDDVEIVKKLVEIKLAN